MSDWLEFIGAYATFFAMHSVPLRPAVRSRLTTVFGRHGFTLLYSALSIFTLGWLIVAAGRAPYVELWGYNPWQNLVPLTVMAIVCGILAFSLGRPNPFSFGGAGNENFDPGQPGIIRWMRHPLLVALALWAAAHLVPNSDLAHVILFGSFAVFALLGMQMIDRRKGRELRMVLKRLDERVRSGPLVPLPESMSGVVFRVLFGILIYMTFLGVHPYLFGVSPLQ